MAPSEVPIGLAPPSEVLMAGCAVGVSFVAGTCGGGVENVISLLATNPAFICHWEVYLHCWVVEKVGSYWT